jgi:hypothetical protein
MKKYGNPEKVEVFSGEEATVVNTHLARTGKALTDFTDEEREAFHKDLEAVQPAKEEASKEETEK